MRMAVILFVSFCGAASLVTRVTRVCFRDVTTEVHTSLESSSSLNLVSVGFTVN